MTFEQYLIAKSLEKARVELIKEAIIADFILTPQQKIDLVNFTDTIATLKDFFDMLSTRY